MISFLRGTVASKTPSELVIDVGGVGFACGISLTTSAALPMPETDQEVKVLTRLQVRDDALTLFGFATDEERVAFDHLIAITGVGPKLALSVLSTFSSQELRSVVASEDIKRMTSVPGVGKKTAQRMLLELRDAFQDLTAEEAVGLPGSQAGSLGAMEDATAALLSMGFSPQEAEVSLRGYDGPASDAESAIKYALKRLGGNA